MLDGEVDAMNDGAQAEGFTDIFEFDGFHAATPCHHVRTAFVLDAVRPRQLLVAPNLWAGVGLVRNAAGTALVGTPAQVAERLREYQAAGIDLVIGSGYPHLEEAYRVAELLFPALGLGAQQRALVETVSNEFAVGFHGKEQVRV